MPYASGILAGTSYVAETTQGVTPGSPTMKSLRLTTKELNLAKELLESQEARSDRETQDVRHGFNSVGGRLGFESSLQSHDDFYEAAMAGTWAAGTAVTPIGATASTSVFTRATGSFITDGYRVGDYVTSAGFTAGADNGTFRVTAVAALSLTVSGTLVDEVAGGGKTLNLTGKRLSTGVVMRTFTMERLFPDVTQYEVFRGVSCDGFSLSIKPKQLVGGEFTMLGMIGAGLSATSLGVPTAAPTTNPITAFNGGIFEGGTAIAVVTGVDAMVKNNRELADVVGSSTSPAVFEGNIETSGTVTALFTDAVMLNKFKNETGSSLAVRMQDPDDATQFLNLVIPNLKYVGGNMAPPKKGPIIVTLPFRGLRHATYGTSIWLQRSN